MILDLSVVPKSEFSVKKCSELYDDFVADNEQVPSKILIRVWQKMLLSSDMTWRGVPLEIK